MAIHLRNVAGLTTWIALSITGCVLALKNGDKSYAPLLGVVCLFCFGGSIGGFIGSLIGGTRFDYQLGFMLGGFLIFILLCGFWLWFAADGARSSGLTDHVWTIEEMLTAVEKRKVCPSNVASDT